MKNAILLSCFLPLTLCAATPVTKEIKFKTRDLEKVQQELNRKKEETQRLKREAEGLSATVKEQEAKIKNIEQTLHYTQRKNSEIAQNLAVTKNKHDETLSLTDQKIKLYQESLRKYYVASLLKGPNDMGAVMSRQAIHAQANGLRNIKNSSSDIQRKLMELIDTQKIIRDEVNRQQEKLSDVKDGVASNEKLLVKKMSRQEILENEVKELGKTAQELASLIDVLRTRSKEEAVAEKQARMQKQLSGQSPILPRSLPWPIAGKVGTKFGRQENPKTGTTYISNGVNILSDEANVSAVADGKVLYAGQFMSYGSMVVVEHAGDWYSVYGHLAKWDVEKGQEIKKGSPIGQARLTANSKKETYFELRFYGKPTDPLPWLSQDN